MPRSLRYLRLVPLVSLQVTLNRWAPTAAASIPLVVYLPLAIRRYGWSDDFPHLYGDGTPIEYETLQSRQSVA